MNKSEIISEGLLYELKANTNDPLKAVIDFCAFNDLIHTRLLLPYVGVQNIFHYVRNILTVWIDSIQIEYELVGLLNPQWKLKTTSSVK
jgi:hypothetical protein